MNTQRYHWLIPLFSAWLFASYPVIFMWSKNWEDVFVREVALDLSLIFTATTVLYVAYRTYFKNSVKASIAASLSNFMFFSFGYIFNHASPTFILLKETTKIWNYNVLIPLWIVLFFACLYRLKSTSEKLCSFLYNLQNILSLGLLLSTSFPLFARLFQNDRASDATPKLQASARKRPNIYYIILDEYARHDVLENLYDFDNTPFLEKLEQQGFFIARKSCSNYSMTSLSLPSSLSMNFLDVPEEDKQKPYYSPWRYSPSLTISRSPLIQLLKEYGYQFVHISSGFGFTLQLKIADLELGDYYFSSFTSFLLDRSLWGPFARRFPRISLEKTPAKTILDQLHYLEESATLPSPHFVFCHILCPHDPFVFDENGNEVPEYEKVLDHSVDYSEPYKKQLTALNQKLLPTLTTMLTHDPDSIIIIQSDHGVAWYKGDFKYFYEKDGRFQSRLLPERMGILNAYHFPENDKPSIPEDVTPVNSFRIILNHYLGTKLPLLPNTCCWSMVPRPFEFIEYPSEEINKIEIKKDE